MFAAHDRYEDLRKAELEVELNDFLGRLSSRWAHEPKLAGYFASRARSEAPSPIKREPPERAITRRRAIRGRSVE